MNDKKKAALHIHPPETFSQLILAWFDIAGRKDLPWQKNLTPYRVWLSEIMLQQTQVITVIPYYQRFINAFPTLKSLSHANIDSVLQLWSGLGYYTRARNLHKCAQIIVQEYHGRFPKCLQQLQKLPGIGRSTAGAIAAISMKIRAPILDGNVKRVLTRYAAIAGVTQDKKINQQLWILAETFLPHQRIDDYTQAMMDLGATICTRSQPKCEICPLQYHCVAYANKTQHLYPTAKPKKTLPIKSVQMLLLLNQQQQLLLEKRPPEGIWGGLWSLPECEIESDLKKWCLQHYACQLVTVQPSLTFRHTFTHFHLDISAVIVRTKPSSKTPALKSTHHWYVLKEAMQQGIAAPVKRLILNLIKESQLCQE